MGGSFTVHSRLRITYLRRNYLLTNLSGARECALS